MLSPPRAGDCCFSEMKPLGVPRRGGRWGFRASDGGGGNSPGSRSPTASPLPQLRARLEGIPELQAALEVRTARASRSRACSSDLPFERQLQVENLNAVRSHGAAVPVCGPAAREGRARLLLQCCNPQSALGIAALRRRPGLRRRRVTTRGENVNPHRRFAAEESPRQVWHVGRNSL